MQTRNHGRLSLLFTRFAAFLAFLLVVSEAETAESVLSINDIVKVKRVVMSDKYRDRQTESDAERYAGEFRTFTEGSIDVVEATVSADESRRSMVFQWGRVDLRYEARAGCIDLHIEVANDSEMVIEYIEMTLFEVEFPGETKIGYVTTLPHWAGSKCNIGGPDILRALSEDRQVLWLSKQPNKPVRQQFLNIGGNKFALIMKSGDPKGGTEVYDGCWDSRPIKPGETDTFELTLRYASHQDDPFKLAEDVLGAFGEEIPPTLNWLDRRPVAAVHVADGRSSEKNPRGWVHGIPLPADWDINTPDSYKTFHEAAIKGAENIAKTARRLGAQGIVVWQIEGQQYSQAVYYGDPQILPHISPEMDAAADDFFAIIRNAGLRVGVCIRPTVHFPGDAEKNYWSTETVPWDEMTMLWTRGGGYEIPDSCLHLYSKESAWDMVSRLDDKIRYAKQRWGATLFYIDTNGIWRPRDKSAEDLAWAGKTLPAEVFRELQQRHPDVLLIPEHKYLEYFGSTAPYSQPPQFGNPTGHDVRAAYPESFCVINTTDSAHIFDTIDRYIKAVVSGDSYFPHGWYLGSWEVLRAIYHPAAALAPYQILVDENAITLNGLELADAETLKRHLAEQIAGNPPLPQRRAFVRYTEDVSVQALQAVLDAVTQANGVIAWTQLDDDSWREWRGFWKPDNPVRSQTEHARAIVYNEKDAAKVFIANAANEEHVVAFEIDIEGLGIGAATPDDVHIEHLDTLASKEPIKLPEDAVEALEQEEKDDLAEDLVRAIEIDEVRDARSKIKFDDFKFDKTNFWFEDGVLQLLVEPMSYRVIYISRR